MLTRELLARLPKAELHTHLDSALRPATMVELARAAKFVLPTTDPDALRRFMVVSDAGSLEDYLARSWDIAFTRRDANDLLAQIGIWQRGDISQCSEFGGDLNRALAAIKAHILLMPGETDRYFDVRDNEAELGHLVNAKSAELHPIPSIHGHRAGNPINNPADRAFINAEISALLQR